MEFFLLKFLFTLNGFLTSSPHSHLFVCLLPHMRSPTVRRQIVQFISNKLGTKNNSAKSKVIMIPNVGTSCDTHRKIFPLFFLFRISNHFFYSCLKRTIHPWGTRNYCISSYALSEPIKAAWIVINIFPFYFCITLFLILQTNDFVQDQIALIASRYRNQQKSCYFYQTVMRHNGTTATSGECARK